MSKEIPEAVKDALRNIGLTDYEIAIYLTLIVKGPMDARELSEASGVPYSRIYNILTQLEKEKMFLHKEEESRPSRYFCKSPDEALVIAKKQYNADFDRFANIVINNLNPIYQSHDTPIKIALYVHRGRDVCITRSLAVIENSKNSLFLVAQTYEFLEIFFNDLKRARARGVTDIRILIEEKALEEEKFKAILIKYKEISIIKMRDQIFGDCVIADEGEDAFIILTQKFFKGLSYFGVVTDHIAFGPAANYYFNYLYTSAQDLDL